MIKISKKELKNIYTNQKLNTTEIGKLYERGREAIRQKLINYGIPRRNQSERHKGLKQSKLTKEKRSIAMQGLKHPFWGKYHSEKTKQKMSISHKGLFSGENHPSWLGGISFEPYSIDFNNELKLKIRKRDKFICQICGISENGKAHGVHHADYCKKNNRPENLVTLCNKCHPKTNFNREYWQNYFVNIIQNKEDKIEI